MNKHQLPEIEPGASFKFKHQVVTFESERQVQLFSPFLTLPDVNIDAGYAILLESNQKLSRKQKSRSESRIPYVTFNESHIPALQQMDKMYSYLKNEVNEAQIELNTLSDSAESIFPPASSLGNPQRRRSTDGTVPHNRTR